MAEIAKRTLPWSGGIVDKDKPVPPDVPEGYRRDWRRRGWLDGTPDAVETVEQDVKPTGEQDGFVTYARKGAPRRSKSDAGRVR